MNETPKFPNILKELKKQNFKREDVTTIQVTNLIARRQITEKNQIKLLSGLSHQNIRDLKKWLPNITKIQTIPLKKNDAYYKNLYFTQEEVSSILQELQNLTKNNHEDKENIARTYRILNSKRYIERKTETIESTVSGENISIAQFSQAKETDTNLGVNNHAITQVINGAPSALTIYNIWNTNKEPEDILLAQAIKKLSLEELIKTLSNNTPKAKKYIEIIDNDPEFGDIKKKVIAILKTENKEIIQILEYPQEKWWQEIKKTSHLPQVNNSITSAQCTSVSEAIADLKLANARDTLKEIFEDRKRSLNTLKSSKELFDTELNTKIQYYLSKSINMLTHFGAGLVAAAVQTTMTPIVESNKFNFFKTESKSEEATKTAIEKLEGNSKLRHRGPSHSNGIF